MINIPTKAMLKLNSNKIYKIVNMFFDTQQVTLEEKSNVWNTVNFSDVVFMDD